MRIMIGITSYNRGETLARMVSSLLASHLEIDGVEYAIRVFDDCSKEYSEHDIRALFPTGIDYYRHPSNHGADYNIGYMYRSFLESDDDILFNCDSDLIFDMDWLNVLLEYLPRTDGLLSLFNSSTHSVKEYLGELCIKDSVGSAGTIMTREIVKIICDSIDEKESYNSLDYNWCNLLKKRGKKIYCTSRSYVQHIGFEGYNSANGRMDIGEGFKVNNTINGQILGDVLHDIAVQSGDNKPERRLFYFMFPFDRIPSGKNVVIYGAGVVGKDYVKQLEMCDYCSNLWIVDKNYKDKFGVSSPEILKDIECDYIVVAAHFSSVRDDMKADILKINPELEGKLVCDVCYSIRY